MDRVDRDKDNFGRKDASLMEQYGIDTYGESVADVYDEWYATYEEHMIDVLSQLTGGGRALELGIGTGRIALPLQERGVEVHGIDASKSMLAKLKAKPGGAEIPISFGDFSKVEAEGQFDLIYIVFNTFFALLTQEDQILCFQNAAMHLKPDGVFLLTVFVPDLKRLQVGQELRVTSLERDQTHLDVSQFDVASQQIIANHIVLTEKGTHFYPVRLRYAWPSELDLMARLAGLILKERWSDWDRSAFNSESTRHISLYTLP
jgi:SAM-dependent methyltransferase